MNNEYKRRAFEILDDQFATPNGKKGKLAQLIDEINPEADSEFGEPERHWPGMYDPEAGENYFHPMYIGEVRDNTQSSTDFHRAQGCCCKTKEESEFVKARIEAKRDIIDRLKNLNDGWTPDWSDCSQEKFFMELDHDDKHSICICSTNVIQAHPDRYYGSRAAIFSLIIEEFGEEKVKLAIWQRDEEEE